MLKEIAFKIRNSAKKTKEYLSKGIENIFCSKKITEETLELLEELLLSADIGPSMTEKIISEAQKLRSIESESTGQIREIIQKYIGLALSKSEKSLSVPASGLHVILFCGVNGNGKTTTVGKLAHKFVTEGKRVMVAACDLFRAAAVEQLESWAKRSSAYFFHDENITNPSAAAYKAVEKAIAEKFDVVLIDTSGRIQTQKNLMEELRKTCMVVKKLLPAAPHDVILTVDASTGQNAVHQLTAFKDAADVTGLVVTKLDGTAKGGVIVALAEKHPDVGIYFIGTGEKVDDLVEFSADEFANSLLEQDIVSKNSVSEYS